MTHTIHNYGERSLLVTLPPTIRPNTVARALTSQLGVNARVGLDTVLVSDRHLPDPARVSAIIEALSEQAGEHPTRTITIPVRYDGVDLADVASFLGASERETIDAHQNTLWRVALIGFAPGFPYLVPADDISPFQTLPRLAAPRTQVPAGSIALAAGMSAIYPTSLPGGWRLIGTTDTALFDPNSSAPSLLTAGDLVKFEEVRK